MNILRIELPSDNRTFSPGEKVPVRLSWKLTRPVRALALQTAWHTNSDYHNNSYLGNIALKLKRPPMEGEHQHDLILPKWPHSHEGEILNVHWTMMLVILPSRESVQVRFSIRPSSDK